jgi:hypothetical protein
VVHVWWSVSDHYVDAIWYWMLGESCLSFGDLLGGVEAVLVGVVHEGEIAECWRVW